MKPEETIDFHIRWIWSKIARLYNTEAARHDGTMSMGYILLNIEKEGTPSTRLGPKMGMESRSLSRSLKVMEERGLIRRRTDAEDRRMVRVYLTKQGERMRELSKDVVIRFNERMRDELSEKDLQTTMQTLQRISQIIDENEIFETVEHETNH